MTEAIIADDQLLFEFERGTLPAEAFHHEQHVRTAWLFVRRDGMPDALTTFSAALRRFAAANGAPRLYHVTITWAYLLLIAERQRACEAREWASFASANRDLLAWKPSILDVYYTPDTLWSEAARATFVMPDRGLSSGCGAGDAANQT